jgi:glycosyltransferase involved in cell wall biosynthesis
MGVLPETVVFLSLSRLVDSKRVDRIVAAMAVAKDRSRSPIELWIAGDGPQRAAIEAQCRAAGLPARFLGTVQHDRVPTVMAAADVFVSTSELTNMSIPTCEAMVLGRPVVALDVSGTSECVRDGETGLLAAENDPAALAACIGRIADDRALRERLGAGAREFAARNFMDWNQRVGAELELVRRLTSADFSGVTR